MQFPDAPTEEEHCAAIERRRIEDEAINKAYDVLTHVQPIRARQCVRCGAQWQVGRYGLELAPRAIVGAAAFTCPDCAGRS
jgi:hypothetical protein